MQSLPDLLKVTPEQLGIILSRIRTLPEEVQRKLDKELKQYQRLLERERRQTKFLDYVRAMWPAFIPGRHIDIMADAFERVVEGKLRRLMIHMPPRFGKSQCTSILFPSWYIGKFPDRKIIQACNTGDLAVDWGGKAKDYINSGEFQNIFPGVKLHRDTKAKGHWRTSHGGEYFAIGIQGTVTGKGADVLLIDDPHSEGEAVAALTDPTIYDKSYQWFTSGPVQRLMPDGAIIITATRWSKRDLPGQIRDSLKKMDSPEKWEIIEFPAILDDGEPTARSLWPAFWPLEKLIAKKAEINDVHKWNSQYQQNPTSEEGAIVKREWWKVWHPESKDAADLGLVILLDKNGNAVPPKCEFLIQTWDTAHTQKTRSDPTGCTTWGVFSPRPETNPDLRHLILMNAWDIKLEYPELKARALKEWKEWQPDNFIVEAKSSGLDLIHELRRMGIPVQDFSVSRGSKLNPNDKFARLNSITDIIKSGMVWIPPYKWAERVMNQVAEFPNGEHDEYVDLVVMALKRFRDGGFIRLPTDEADEKRDKPRIADYY